MGQVLQTDKIGALTESGGTITLAASRLTIGGQQYSTGSLNVAPSLSADTRYYIYVVLSSGVPQLVVSTNDNATGPSGYTSWKLVNIFRSDHTSIFCAFGEIDSNGIITAESGRNSEGEWKRHVDGTQTCWVNSRFGPVASLGGSASVIWTFPISFITRDTLSVQVTQERNDVATAQVTVSSLTATTATVRNKGTSAVDWTGFATGRWK